MAGLVGDLGTFPLALKDLSFTVGVARTHASCSRLSQASRRHCPRRRTELREAQGNSGASVRPGFGFPSHRKHLLHYLSQWVMLSFTCSLEASQQTHPYSVSSTFTHTSFDPLTVVKSSVDEEIEGQQCKTPCSRSHGRKMADRDGTHAQVSLLQAQCAPCWATPPVPAAKQKVF